MAQRVPVLVLGAGLAGLACAKHLRRPARLLERAAQPGGLAVSETRAGFSFDRAGHWLHLAQPRTHALVEELLGDELVSVERDARIYSHGRLTAYPFQANTFGLPAEVVRDCLLGFVQARERRLAGAPEPPGFEGFIQHHMGEGFARHFLLPYNRKLWSVPLEALSAAWCGRFVPRPSLEEVVAGAVGLTVQGMGYNARFVYPASGGIGRLPAALAATLPHKPELEVEALQVDLAQRRVLSSRAEWIPYETLVSTLPLPQLIDRVLDPSPELRAARAGLRATHIVVAHLGVEGPALFGAHWVYVPEARFPFFRVGCYSNALPGLAPPGCSGLYVELSLPPEASLEALPRAEILGSVRRGLVAMGALDEQTPVRVEDLRVLPGAYVLFDHHHGEAVARARGALWRAGRVRSIGRYGRWTYGGMEDALLDGIDCAERIEQGDQEEWE